MEPLFRFDTVSEYNALNNHATLHPLVSIIDFSKAQPRSWNGKKKIKINYGLYCIFLKEIKCGDIKYGCNYYDYEEGTLVFISPGQVMEFETTGEVYQPMGHALVFHPDLIHGTSLASHMNEFSFFGYQSNEALHLSEKERQLVMDCFSKIDYELQQSIDKHSKKLIVANIELFLKYCSRFYDRQFITRDKVNFSSNEPQQSGLPSVGFCANALHLSANYFGDLIKKETGKSAQEYIQNRIIDAAKNKILEGEKTINEIAFDLGFKYPQHLTRLFKQRVGCTPKEYRVLN
jgi:AraC-like DNA-binding protein